MTTSPILARRQLRLAALQALVVLQLSDAVKQLDSPGTWMSQPEKMPAVLVRSPRTSKETMSRSTSNFTSTIVLEIETRITGATAQEAQDSIEQLDALVEQALLSNVAFVALSQQISIDTETEITAEARNHIAGTRMHVRCELPETFDPISDAPEVLQPVAPPLEGVDLHADLVATFDPNGVYGDVLFPTAVQPTPRTSGPDGRDEGGFEINFST